jgi:hypothetical protein
MRRFRALSILVISGLVGLVANCTMTSTPLPTADAKAQTLAALDNLLTASQQEAPDAAAIQSYAIGLREHLTSLC